MISKDEKYREMLFSINDGAYIFFGAGISKLTGYKLWDELKKELINYFKNNTKKIKKENYLHTFEYSFYNKLKAHYKNDEAFDCLYSWDPNLFILVKSEIFDCDSRNICEKKYIKNL